MLTLGPPATRPLQLAAAVLWLLAVVALVLAVLEGLSTQSHRVVVGVGGALTLVAYALALAFIGRGLWQGKRWSRGPAAALTLINLPVAWSFVGGATTWVAIALALTSVVVLVCILLPSSTQVMMPASLKQSEDS